MRPFGFTDTLEQNPMKNLRPILLEVVSGTSADATCITPEDFPTYHENQEKLLSCRFRFPGTAGFRKYIIDRFLHGKVNVRRGKCEFTIGNVSDLANGLAVCEIFYEDVVRYWYRDVGIVVASKYFI